MNSQSVEINRKYQIQLGSLKSPQFHSFNIDCDRANSRNVAQFNPFEFQSVNFDSSPYNCLKSVELMSKIQFNSIQFNSIQFSFIPFKSIQFLANCIRSMPSAFATRPSVSDNETIPLRWNNSLCDELPRLNRVTRR